MSAADLVFLPWLRRGAAGGVQAVVPASVLTRVSTEERLRGRTVLVADDDAAVLHTVEAMLTSEGFCVITARDGREAVDAVEDHIDSIAAVLLDVSMPVMDGWRASKEIRRLRADMPIALASGYGEPSLGDEVQGDRHVTFVAKPYQGRSLLDALAAVLFVEP